MDRKKTSASSLLKPYRRAICVLSQGMLSVIVLPQSCSLFPACLTECGGNDSVVDLFHEGALR
jgi:hypothetical protein